MATTTETTTIKAYMVEQQAGPGECCDCGVDAPMTYCSLNEQYCRGCIRDTITKCEVCGNYVASGYTTELRNGGDACFDCTGD